MNGRERIVSAAANLFEKVGYESATMDDITEKAGVSKGLAYHHFRSKDELLAEIIQLRLAEYDLLVAALKKEPKPKARLALLTTHLRKELLEQEQKQRFLVTTYIHPKNARFVSDAIQADPARFAALLQEEMRLLQDLGFKDAERELPVFRATIQGIALCYLINPEGYPLEEAIERFTENYTT